MGLTEAAYERALGVLQRCSVDRGFRASGEKPGYPQVWARDSVIASLGAAASGDPDLIAVFRSSLNTLREQQSPLGMIPLNVHPETGDVSSENAGALDSNLWYVLGHYFYYQLTGNGDYLESNLEAIRRAILWLRYQDMNDCGLLEIPEAGNWMDLLAVRYNTLYDNVLFYAALKSAAQMLEACGADASQERKMAEDIYERLNLLMWIERGWRSHDFADRLERLKEMRLEWYMLYHNMGTISSRPYYLPYVAFREYGDYCDTLGNLLSIICGVADTNRREQIIRYLYQVGMAVPYPSKAVHPVILPGHPDWRDYYRSRNLNLPHQYHNGGIWPFIGGFHIAALVKMGWLEEAHNLLEDLAKANQQGAWKPWEFNEWLHGQSGNPMGCGYQAWSAGMYIYAYESVEREAVPFFETL